MIEKEILDKVSSVMDHVLLQLKSLKSGEKLTAGYVSSNVSNITGLKKPAVDFIICMMFDDDKHPDYYKKAGKHGGIYRR